MSTALVFAVWGQFPKGVCEASVSKESTRCLPPAWLVVVVGLEEKGNRVKKRVTEWTLRRKAKVSERLTPHAHTGAGDGRLRSWRRTSLHGEWCGRTAIHHSRAHTTWSDDQSPAHTALHRLRAHITALHRLRAHINWSEGLLSHASRVQGILLVLNSTPPRRRVVWS